MNVEIPYSHVIAGLSGFVFPARVFLLDNPSSPLPVQRLEEIPLQELLTSIDDRCGEATNNERDDDEDVKVSLFQPRNFITAFDDDFSRLATEDLLVVSVEANPLFVALGELDFEFIARRAVLDHVELFPLVARRVGFEEKVSRLR